MIATWRMHGIVVRALHLEYDNDTTARMREVPAPAAKAYQPPLSIPSAESRAECQAVCLRTACCASIMRRNSPGREMSNLTTLPAKSRIASCEAA